MRIVVTSTARRAPTATDCVESVRAQRECPPFVHCFACADDYTLELANGFGTDAFLSPVPALENLVGMWSKCAPDDVIVHLDGDDWLPHDRVLSSVAADYVDPNCWLTYGRFIRSDDVLDADWSPDFGTRYDARDSPRVQRWRASHLKTFRAGLVQTLIRDYPDHLRDARGVLYDTCLDRAVMLPLLELAGERYRCAPDIRCVYHYDAHAAGQSHRERFREMLDAQRIHGYPPLTKLEGPTW
jgi:hypothetical protein